ncbi:MAG: CBS domain-containing protein [Deltaproteobacteria bacterium]|nr:MAG: CBS domain-containing protein [Deltaproteobacteria bacterium]
MNDLWKTLSGFTTKRVADPVRNVIFRTLSRLGVTVQSFNILLAVVVGVLSGLGAVVFIKLIDLFTWIFFDKVHGDLLGRTRALIFILPAIGGLLIAPLIKLFPTEAKGDGVPDAMEAITLKGGILKPRTTLIRTFTAAATLGSGGSVGREAPIAQIGAALGSSVGQFLRLSGEMMKTLVGCGAAGGIAAVFNAPIGGVFFALEVMIGDFSLQTFGPIVISSVIATVTMRAFLGDILQFQVPHYELRSAIEFVPYAVLGAICGVLAVGFIRLLDWTEEFFNDRLRVNPLLKPAIGGLIVGLIAILFPQILGTEMESVNTALFGQGAWFFLLFLGLLKIFTTSVSIGSGGSGGVLGPSLFIGGMLGGAIGKVFSLLFPSVVTTPGAYGLVGMGAFLASVVHAPITGIMIVFEMTNDYKAILPLMEATIIAMVVAKRLLPYSLYTYKLHLRGIDIVSGREMGVLKSLRVSDIMKKEFTTISPSATFDEMVNVFINNPTNYLYILDGDHRLAGVVSFSDIKSFVKDEELAHLVRAYDVATTDVVSVCPDDDLYTALNRFGYKNVEQLPVIDNPITRRLIGVIYRKDLLQAYQKELIKMEFREE